MGWGWGGGWGGWGGSGGWIYIVNYVWQGGVSGFVVACLWLLLILPPAIDKVFWWTYQGERCCRAVIAGIDLGQEPSDRGHCAVKPFIIQVWFLLRPVSRLFTCCTRAVQAVRGLDGWVVLCGQCVEVPLSSVVFLQVETTMHWYYGKRWEKVTTLGWKCGDIEMSTSSFLSFS